MSGGGGGSILAMIQTLRNNKALLSKRDSYFKGGSTHNVYNKTYRKKLNSFRDQKPVSEEELNKIRKKFQSVKRWNNILTAFLFTVGTLIVGYWLNSILSQKQSFQKHEERINTVTFSKLKPQPYRDQMKLGILKMKEKNYFMASGNFKRALIYQPEDLVAEYYLTKAYYSLCVARGQACKMAKSKIKENRKRFLDEDSFKYLEEQIENN